MEQQAELFQLIQASLFTDEDVTITDPQAVFGEMMAQSVAALPYEWLRKHRQMAVDLGAKPSSDEDRIFETWSRFCVRNTAQWVRVMRGQDQLLKLLQDHLIPCVIIKGAAAAMAYPNPMLRAMGDVDFLVKRENFERAAELLESSGYELAHDKNDEHHHYGYAYGGISYELHKRLGIVSEENEKLLRLFEDGIDSRVWHETGGLRFPVLPDALNGLVLIFHIDQHLRSGLGLRQIIDWMMYVHGLSEEVWNELHPLLKSTGHERLAFVVTALCERYLGLKTPVSGLENACGEVEESVVDALLEHILEKGNFGRKIPSVDGKMEEVSLMATEKGGFFRRLQAGGMSRWKAARKHRILRPFAWIYQSFRIMGELAKNKVTPGKIAKNREKGLEQRKLLKELGLEVERKISG